MATMEMIGKTALDVKFNAQNGGHHRFVENLQTTMTVRNFLKPYYFQFTYRSF
jgi:hypothetical protein